MREIKFRGFHPDENEKEKVFVNGEWINGCWVYGYYFKEKGDFIRQRPSSFFTQSYLVISETIGQYTGLKDKNGTRIFEGDIVKYGDTAHKVVFENRNGTAYFGLVYSGIETLPFGHYQDFEQIEVIGNIFENPELVSEA